MSEHVSVNQIARYRGRQLPAAELVSVSEHVSECEACRKRLESAVSTDPAFFALRSEIFEEGAPSPAHPQFDEIANFLDGTLRGDDLQIMKDHLSRCEECALTVEDLGGWRHSADVAVQPQSWWDRWSPYISGVMKLPRVAFATGVVAVLLAVAVLYFRQIEPAKQADQQVEPENRSAAVASPALVQLIDGGRRITLDREGKLSGLDDVRPEYQQMVRDALAREQLERSPFVAGLLRPGSSLMGSDDQGERFSVLEPAGKVVIETRPVFRWSDLSGASGYVVEVYDEKFELVAASPKVTGTTWMPTRPLGRGSVYSWQVKATKAGKEFVAPRPPAPQASFRVLDAAKANELDEQRSQGTSRLIVALLYTQAGLLDEAERELLTLLGANPDSMTIARLLASVRAMR